MSNYAQVTFFAPKDALITGNPAKLIKGSEVDPELSGISTAITSKLDASGATFLAADGLVGSPSHSFASDTDTGAFHVAANSAALVANAVAAITWSVTGADSTLILGATSASSMTLNLTSSATATAGAAGAPPAQVVGYLVVTINGTARKVPYYAT